MKKTFCLSLALCLGFFLFNKNINAQTQTYTDLLYEKLSSMPTARVLMIKVTKENRGDFPNSVLFPKPFNDTLNDITTGSLALVQRVFSDYYSRATHSNISFIRYRGKNMAFSSRHSHGSGQVGEHLKKIFARPIGDNADGVIFDSLNMNLEGQKFLEVSAVDTLFNFQIQNVKVTAVDFSAGDTNITAFIIKGSAVYFSPSDLDSIFSTAKSEFAHSDFPRGAYLIKVQDTAEDIPGMSGGIATFSQFFGEEVLLGVQTNLLLFGTNIPGITIKFLCVTPIFSKDLKE